MKNLLKILLGGLFLCSFYSVNAVAKDVNEAFFLEWPTPNQEAKFNKAYDEAMGELQSRWRDELENTQLTSIRKRNLKANSTWTSYADHQWLHAKMIVIITLYAFSVYLYT